MSQRQWFLYKDVAIAEMIEIMKVRSTKTGSLNGDLHLIRPWRLESSIFLPEYYNELSDHNTSGNFTYYPQIFDTM